MNRASGRQLIEVHLHAKIEHMFGVSRASQQ